MHWILWKVWARMHQHLCFGRGLRENLHHRPCSFARTRGPDSADDGGNVVGSQNPGTGVESVIWSCVARMASRPAPVPLPWLRGRCGHAPSITTRVRHPRKCVLSQNRRGLVFALQGTLDAMFTCSFPSLLSLRAASPSFLLRVQTSCSGNPQFEIHAFAHAPRKPALYNCHEQNISDHPRCKVALRFKVCDSLLRLLDSNAQE